MFDQPAIPAEETNLFPIRDQAPTEISLKGIRDRIAIGEPISGIPGDIVGVIGRLAPGRIAITIAQIRNGAKTRIARP